MAASGGAEADYLSQVASGLDDCCSGHREADCRRVGGPIGGLGLAGKATGEDLRAVVPGVAPGTGSRRTASG